MWSIVALAWAARAALVAVPSMWLWGLNVQRFLAPLPAWLPWSLAALTLVPPVARALVPACSALGDTIARRPLLAALVAGAVLGALVLALPDRLQYAGDSLLRIGAIERGESPRVLSPQAFPLDVALHYTLPRRLMLAHWMTASHAVRAVGAFGAAALAMAAVLFVRALGLAGAPAFAAFAVTCFGGCLCLYTGESKSFAEICVALVAFAACALLALRDRRWLLGVGVAFAVALALHRYALGLLPALALTWAFAWRAGAESRGGRWVTVLANVVPLAALAVMAPTLWHTVGGFDVRENFLGATHASPIAAAFDPVHLADVVDLGLMLCPLAIALPVLAWALPKRDRIGAEAGVLLAILVPFALVLLFAQPPRGLTRFWDAFTPAGIALALCAAWGFGRALSIGARAWIAVGVAAVSIAASVQWLAHFADRDRGAARIEALMREPPRRSAIERAANWDFLGWNAFNHDRMSAASDAWSRSVEAAPNPRTIMQWAMAEHGQEHYAEARELYRRAVAADSTQVMAWFGVAVTAISFNDLEECSDAARHLQRLAPDNPKTREILAYIAKARTAGVGATAPR